MENWCICFSCSKFIYSSSKVVMYICRCVNFDISMIYLPVRFFFVLFHILTKIIALGHKSSEKKLWESLYLIKENGDQKILSVGSKSYKLITNGKDNINKKVKYIVNIQICNDFDMSFCSFRGSNSSIFNNMNMLFWCFIGRNSYTFNN